MFCPACKTAAVYGDGHRCPGAAWEKMAWVGVGLAAVYLVICVVRLVFTFHETSSLVNILNAPTADGVNQINSLSNTESLMTNLTLLGVFVYIAGYVVFFQAVRKAIRSAGLNSRSLLQHWTYYAWRGAVLVSLLLAFAGNASADTTASTDPATLISQVKHVGLMNELYLGVRIVTVFILIGAIFSLRDRVRTALRAAGSPAPYGAYQQPQGAAPQF
jgi:hypothetical protein